MQLGLAGSAGKPPTQPGWPTGSCYLSMQVCAYMFTFCGRYTGSADPDSTLLTNIQNMAGVLTENLLNGCLKGIQHIEGNERLNGTTRRKTMIIATSTG